MIVTVTLNPSLDLFMQTAGGWEFGEEVNRAETSWLELAGKGVNAARAAAVNGALTEARIVAGAASRSSITALAETLDFPVKSFEIPGFTRINVHIREGETGRRLKVNDRGPDISDHQKEIIAFCTAGLTEGAILLLSGSLPSGCGSDLYCVIAREAQLKGARVCFDAGGIELREALIARPWLVKPNRRELGAALGKETASLEEVEAGVRKLCQLGAENALVTNASRPGFALFDGELIRFEPPEVEIQTTVGAGDAFTGALLAGFERQLSPRESITMAVEYAISIIRA